MTNSKYRLLIVDDEYLVRLGLSNTIDWDALGIEIIGEASNGQQGFEMALKGKPDLIISDVKMPLVNGVEMVCKLQEANFEGRIIMLSGYRDFEYAKETFEHGVFAYVLKPVDNAEIIDVVKRALEDLIGEREQKHLYEGLRQELPTVRQQIVKDILVGNIVVIDDIIAKLKLVDLPVIGAGSLILIKQDENGTNAPLEAIKGLMEEELSLKSHFSCKMDNFLVWIAEETDASIIEKEFEAIIRIYQQDNQETLTVAISVFQSLGNIHTSYLQAQNTIASKLFVGLNTIENAVKERPFYKKSIIAAMEIIAGEYKDDITVKSVAERLNVSESHLMHLFKSSLNRTFVEMVTAYRIHKAKQLLATGRYRIFEVSDMVGYHDEKYFSSVFKKVLGIMPSAYINAMPKHKNDQKD